LNKTILSFYEVRELMPHIIVSDREIEDAYKKNQSEYSSGEAAEISVYTFDTEENAYIGRMGLLNGVKNNPSENVNKSQISGLKEVNNNISVTRNNNPYPTNVIYTVFKLKDNQLSQPMKLSNEFIVIQKHKETGSIIKPIEEVREDIFYKSKKLKCDSVKNNLILAAKEKYQMRVNKILSNH
jgi:hypothetical protein